jgi:hypothetical protein
MDKTMAAFVAGSAHSPSEFGFTGVVKICKQILNAFAQRAAIAAERSQFATLSSRYLDDIGMTAGERAAVLHYEEPMIDSWRVVASHL